MTKEQTIFRVRSDSEYTGLTPKQNLVYGLLRIVDGILTVLMLGHMHVRFANKYSMSAVTKNCRAYHERRKNDEV